MSAQSSPNIELPSVEKAISSDREKVVISHIAQLNNAKQVGSRNPFSISLPIRGASVPFSAIPNDVIERRYKNGITNLFKIYFPIVDQILIFDNSEGKHELIAEKNIDEEIYIHNVEKFNELKNYHDKGN